MKTSITLLLALIIAASSCTPKNAYSPLDTYIKTSVNRYSDSVKEVQSNKAFISNLNK